MVRKIIPYLLAGLVSFIGPSSSSTATFSAVEESPQVTTTAVPENTASQESFPQLQHCTSQYTKNNISPRSLLEAIVASSEHPEIKRQAEKEKIRFTRSYDHFLDGLAALLPVVAENKLPEVLCYSQAWAQKRFKLKSSTQFEKDLVGRLFYSAKNNLRFDHYEPAQRQVDLAFLVAERGGIETQKTAQGVLDRAYRKAQEFIGEGYFVSSRKPINMGRGVASQSGIDVDSHEMELVQTAYERAKQLIDEEGGYLSFRHAVAFARKTAQHAHIDVLSVEQDFMEQVCAHAQRLADRGYHHLATTPLRIAQGLVRRDARIDDAACQEVRAKVESCLGVWPPCPAKGISQEYPIVVTKR